MIPALPNLVPGDLVASDGLGVGLLIRIYDHDTGADATISDAKTKLLTATIQVGEGLHDIFIHELQPYSSHERFTK